MKDQILNLLQADNAEGAIALLQAQDNPSLVVETCHEVMKHLYWEEKNLPASTLMGWTGLQYGLFQSVEIKDVDQWTGLLSQVKGIAYDLASFTWVGWGEEDIVIGVSDIQLGLDAAKINLRLAQELKKEPLPMSRAYWMLGAQSLALNDLAQANTNFVQAVVYADLAEEPAERLLCRGFLALVDRLQDPKNGQAVADFVECKQKLAAYEHGKIFVDQLDTAFHVFSLQ